MTNQITDKLDTPPEASGRFGGFLRQMRSSRSVSLGALAARAGVAKSTLSKWEAGHYLPRLPELDATLNAMAASPDERRRALQMIDAPRAVARLRRDVRRAAAAANVDLDAPPPAGDLLRAMRLRRGRTVEEVARALGVSTRSVREWERSGAAPTAAHLHSLCHLLGAAEGEMIALNTGGLWLPTPASTSPSPTSLYELERYMKELEFPSRGYDPAFEALKDLAYLALLARLAPQAVHHLSTRWLLLESYSYYAHWLSNQRRHGEAARYAERAMGLARSERAWRMPRLREAWLRSAIVGARATVFGGREGVTPERARAGYERLNTLLPFAAERIPAFGAWALSNLAEYQYLGGGTEAALATALQACDVAERSENAAEPANRQLSRIQLLLKAGRPTEALALLPVQESLYLPFRVSERLARAEALLRAGCVSEAQDWLARAYQTIHTLGIDPVEADALAERF